MSLRLDIPQLRAFATVARLGGFTRAAASLNLTQSAVSWQVRRLEERVGGPLLARDPDGVGLTGRGRDLLPDAERVLAAHDAAVDRLRRSDLAGRVRFGCAEDVIAERLAGVLGRFRRLHPEVRLEVAVDASPLLRARVRAGALDAAILQESGQEPGVAPGRVLWRETPLWARGPDSAIEALRPLPLVTFGESCVYRAAATTALDAAGVPWFPILECPGVTGVRAAIAAGVGIGVLAPRHLALPGGAIEAARTLPPLPGSAIVLVESADPPVPVAPLVALVLDELGAPRDAAA